MKKNPLGGDATSVPEELSAPKQAKEKEAPMPKRKPSPVTVKKAKGGSIGCGAAMKGHGKGPYKKRGM